MPDRTQLQTAKAIDLKPVIVAGSFGMSSVPNRRQGVNANEKAHAFYELPIASGINIVVYANSAGTAGNSLDFQATADGSAKAELDMSTVTTNIDTVVEAAAGGVGGNDWSISVIGGAAAKAGLSHEDTTNKVLTCIMQLGTSDVSDFEALVTASTNLAVGSAGTGATLVASGDECYSQALAGGTAATWAEESGSPSKTTLHFTDTTSTAAACVAAINAVSSGDQVVTAALLSGTGVHAMASGDAVAKQNLAKGEATSDVNSQGFKVSKTDTGEFTVTFDDSFPDMIDCEATLQLVTAADQFVVVGTYTAASRTIVFTIWDVSGAAAADVANNANNRINFIATFVNSSVY